MNFARKRRAPDASFGVAGYQRALYGNGGCRVNGKTIIAFCLVLMSYLTAPLASAEVICLPPAGLTSVTSNENLKYLIFGETHGSVEAPAVFAEAVCAVVTSGKRVLVGLEFPEV